MRILNLVPGADALDEATRLVAEIRSFNAEIDFRLRFLHVDIDPIYVVPPAAADALESEVSPAPVVRIPADDPPYAAALLALLLAKERPDLLLIAGRGELAGPAVAAARAAATKIAVFGGGPSGVEGALELGDDPASALDRLTGVAREIS